MKPLFTLLMSLVLLKAGAQGRVVINEYMPWTGNNCNVTSEFIELLNFGPGPVDIGCYILTEGDYAITIPPNTILQPGEFYVIAGQARIDVGCANLDSATTVHLNWNACSNCTSAPIPTTGDGLFTDGGSAAEQLVLLDPSLRVVDAVVRDIALRESSATITTAAGSCGAKTFDLDALNIRYEEIGESAGRANSFARKVDGDCEWVKDSRQSANATNNTAGETTSIGYTLHLVRSQDCGPGQRGAVTISVSAPDLSAAFPITYTLVYDADRNGLFTLADTYTTGTDSNPPYVEFTELTEGKYRVSVGSALGCNLKTFEFEILPCTAVLPLQLLEFRHLGQAKEGQRFLFRLADAGRLQSASLEQSADGRRFTAAAVIPTRNAQPDGAFICETRVPAQRYFRLRLTGPGGSIQYSPTISLGTGLQTETVRLWPNPAASQVQVALAGLPFTPTRLHIVGSDGVLHFQSAVGAATDGGWLQIPVGRLPTGLYQLTLHGTGRDQQINLRFVKR